MQSNMQLKQESKQHFSLSKSSLINKIDMHLDPKTHTHQTSPTNFIFQKQVKIV